MSTLQLLSLRLSAQICQAVGNFWDARNFYEKAIVFWIAVVIAFSGIPLILCWRLAGIAELG